MLKTITAAIFILILAPACQTHARVENITPDKPAAITVVANNAIAMTEHAADKAVSLEVHNIFVRGERTRKRVEVAANGKSVWFYFRVTKGSPNSQVMADYAVRKENF